MAVGVGVPKLDVAVAVAVAARLHGRGALEAEHGPRRDIILANAAAALVAAGHANDFLEGVRQAAHSIDTGAARAKLDALIAFSAQ